MNEFSTPHDVIDGISSILINFYGENNFYSCVICITFIYDGVKRPSDEKIKCINQNSAMKLEKTSLIKTVALIFQSDLNRLFPAP